MLSIKVLGPGCAKCYAVERAAISALESIGKEFQGLEATVQHIEDPLRIQEYPILYTPGLVVNERLVCAGRIPSKKEVVEWLREAINQPA